MYGGLGALESQLGLEVAGKVAASNFSVLPRLPWHLEAMLEEVGTLERAAWVLDRQPALLECDFGLMRFQGRLDFWAGQLQFSLGSEQPAPAWVVMYHCGPLLKSKLQHVAPRALWVQLMHGVRCAWRPTTTAPSTPRRAQARGKRRTTQTPVASRNFT